MNDSGYDAVIFDLDGTLVRTAPECIYTMVGNALREFGLSASENDMKKLWFAGKNSTFAKDALGIEPKLIWEAIRKYDTKEFRLQHTRPYEDAGFVGELRQNGYKIGMVTAVSPRVADSEIALVGADNFDCIVLARESSGIKPKPHPQGIQECMRRMDVTKDKTVYVGDTNDDIIAAVNAEVFDVLIERNEYKFELIMKPSLQIHSLYELRDGLL